ncbi:MAG: hypothetical protein AAFO74_00805 [Pseudomonadota bacterium]
MIAYIFAPASKPDHAFLQAPGFNSLLSNRLLLTVFAYTEGMKISAGGLRTENVTFGKVQLSAETWAILGIVLLGFCLRLKAASGDLWFDEIWTVKSLQGLNEPSEILTKWISDNNHLLNSLYVFWVKDQVHSFWFRAFSIAISTGSILAGYWAAQAYGSRTRLIFAFQLAAAFPFVLYGSEARGFAGMIFCALTAIGLVERHLKTDKDTPGAALFAICIGIGGLFHMTIFLLLVVLAVWVFWIRLNQENWHFQRALARAHRFFRPVIFVPLIFAVVLSAPVYFHPDRLIEIGSISHFEWSHVADGFDRLLRLVLGAPYAPPMMTQAALIAALVFFLRRPGQSKITLDITPLAVIALGIVPIIMVIVQLPNLQYPRYFLCLALILCLWLSIRIADASKSNGYKRWIAAGLVAVFMHGQFIQYAGFSGPQRGQYRQAIAEISQSGATFYSAAEPFRTMVTIDYFQAIDKSDFKLTHIDLKNSDCEAPPKWFIAEIHRPRDTVRETINLSGRVCTLRYDLHKTYLHYKLSGRSWALYRHAGPD